MTTKRIAISELRITGSGREQANIKFAPGLNLVVGASDTGKTFIFECLDFMLGAKDGLRRLPQSAGYDNVFLSVEPSEGRPFSLRRSFDGGDFELKEKTTASNSGKKLSAKHGLDPNRSLSAYLLRCVGLEGKEVRVNKDGKKTALSFRDVSHLTLINEERIIQQKSPVLTGQYSLATRERSVFAYFLTGQDDSQIVTAEDTGSERAHREGEIAVLESLIAEKQTNHPSSASSSDDLAAQATRLEQSIANLSEAVIATKTQIGEFESRRATLIDSCLQARSKSVFVEEQLKRLRLLGDYYKSDSLRLQAVIEANQVYDSLPEGKCPLCNRPLNASGNENASAHEAFDAACREELRKIQLLQANLQAAIADYEVERAQLQGSLRDLENELTRIDNQLQEVLAPHVRVAQSQLQALIQQRVNLAGEEASRASLVALERRLALAKSTHATPAPTSNFTERATTSSAFDFCAVVEEILRAWKYPNLGTVSFDSAKADLVIGGQDRANKGKGYRALTYAAFTIGLMKYCRMKNIPHSGLVVLDTPPEPVQGAKEIRDRRRSV